jgi:hypothetical protein
VWKLENQQEEDEEDGEERELMLAGKRFIEPFDFILRQSVDTCDPAHHGGSSDSQPSWLVPIMKNGSSIFVRHPTIILPTLTTMTQLLRVCRDGLQNTESAKDLFLECEQILTTKKIRHIKLLDSLLLEYSETLDMACKEKSGNKAICKLRDFLLQSEPYQEREVIQEDEDNDDGANSSDNSYSRR